MQLLGGLQRRHASHRPPYYYLPCSLFNLTLSLLYFFYFFFFFNKKKKKWKRRKKKKENSSASFSLHGSATSFVSWQKGNLLFIFPFWNIKKKEKWKWQSTRRRRRGKKSRVQHLDVIGMFHLCLLDLLSLACWRNFYSRKLWRRSPFFTTDDRRRHARKNIFFLMLADTIRKERRSLIVSSFRINDSNWSWTLFFYLKHYRHFNNFPIKMDWISRFFFKFSCPVEWCGKSFRIDRTNRTNWFQSWEEK